MEITEDKIREIEGKFRLIEWIYSTEPNAYKRIYKIFEEIRFIPVLTYDIPQLSSDEKTNVVFRSRTNPHFDEKFEKLADISYPPSKILNSFGRINEPYQSMFYGSENRPTSYLELVENWVESHNIGDSLSVTIGMWELQRDLKVFLIPKPDIDERISDGDHHYGSVYDEKMKKFAAIEKAYSDVIFRYLSSKFAKPAKNDVKTYMITTAFSNLMFSKNFIDGVLYPSVPFQGQGYNLVLRPNLIDDSSIKLFYVTCDTFQISLAPSGKKHFKQTNSASAKSINAENGKFNW